MEGGHSEYRSDLVKCGERNDGLTVSCHLSTPCVKGPESDCLLHGLLYEYLGLS